MFSTPNIQVSNVKTSLHDPFGDVLQKKNWLSTNLIHDSIIGNYIIE